MKRATIAVMLVVAACDSPSSKQQPTPSPTTGGPAATTVVMPSTNAASTTVVMPATRPPPGQPPPPAPPSRSDNVEIDAPQVEGSIDPDKLRDVVVRRRDVLRDCYEGAARSDAAIEGQLDVAFVVGSSGRATKVTVTGSLAANRPLATCVTGVFQALELPPPSDGTATVTVPVGFGPIR